MNVEKSDLLSCLTEREHKDLFGCMEENEKGVYIFIG